MDRKSHAHAVLSIRGSELRPDDITRRLGVKPTRISTGTEAKGGKSAPHAASWVIDLRVDDLDGLDQAVRSVVDNASRSVAEWDTLTRSFDVDLTLVFYLYRPNQGARLHASTIEMLARKGVGLDLDLYSLAEAG